ncbi:Chemotaxis protein methyltransferase CheR [Candidatus Syntrophocurvum alkaliphilum]|uniref:protein-glutamate O-methyltransferase n=1 Tax=Candidatus Syntrophocurvum alkaliphilum TaxID=2293317 RepID=A0A6I6DHG4_9FIRM|nr:protein-glutamate O-methyltransferase CheR [Candidatus Syntrophocurvum alkaliphilum]QGT99059.1 Chemotaxis protein methyltransferase CheR [Candidatus Syntrophocurvum alkaliphilum]
MATSYGWEWFIENFEAISQINLTSYKRPQMERRINSFMRSVNSSNYKDFLDILSKDKILYKKFIEHLTINVSEFFRNPAHWEVLEKKIIPMLLENKKKLKVWSAGCSTGEEPYSLAMLFKEKFPDTVDEIYATDLDIEVLDKAQIGIYSEKAIQSLEYNYQKKYFIQNKNFFKIKEDIKSMVKFQRQDLLKEAFTKNNDLILCRNVVIYFTEETKQKLYKKFTNSLNANGVLFIGSTEQIFQAKDLGLKPIATFFYQKA